MIKIYHNPRCRKSREGLEYLKGKTNNFEIVPYLDTPFTIEGLTELVKNLDIKPIDLVRTQEDYFKKELKGKNFTDKEWIKILVENPKLIQRPIVKCNDKAVIAQPPEKIDNLL